MSESTASDRRPEPGRLFLRKGKHFEHETGISRSTQNYLVDQGILPPPTRLSERISGWLYAEVEAALTKLRDEQRRGDAA
jgi:predicted DNA-binding transcriptional regulator AlpA